MTAPDGCSACSATRAATSARSITACWNGCSGTGPRRRELPPAERDALLARVFADLRALADAVPRLDLSPADRRYLAEALALVLDFGPDRLAADGALFRALYQPVSILPPDQYLALVLQATEGCSWNRCTFCGLYRDRAFRIHSPESFRDHCARVRDFFGEGMSLRRGIFLADANALIIPQARLVAIFRDRAGIFRACRTVRARSIRSSARSTWTRKSAEDWADLHALGLKRAYIGLETGDDDLLRFLNKPGTVQDAIEAVRGAARGRRLGRRDPDGGHRRGSFRGGSRRALGRGDPRDGARPARSGLSLELRPRAGHRIPGDWRRQPESGR